MVYLPKYLTLTQDERRILRALAKHGRREYQPGIGTKQLTITYKNLSALGLVNMYETEDKTYIVSMTMAGRSYLKHYAGKLGRILK